MIDEYRTELRSLIKRIEASLGHDEPAWSALMHLTQAFMVLDKLRSAGAVDASPASTPGDA